MAHQEAEKAETKVSQVGHWAKQTIKTVAVFVIGGLCYAILVNRGDGFWAYFWTTFWTAVVAGLWIGAFTPVSRRVKDWFRRPKAAKAETKEIEKVEPSNGLDELGLAEGSNEEVSNDLDKPVPATEAETNQAHQLGHAHGSEGKKKLEADGFTKSDFKSYQAGYSAGMIERHLNSGAKEDTDA